jgi:hypothetical protein
MQRWLPLRTEYKGTAQSFLAFQEALIKTMQGRLLNPASPEEL